MKETVEPGYPIEPDVAFDDRQLGLPISPILNDGEDVGDVIEWPSRHRLLAQYLASIGVSAPERMAGAMLRDFGSISRILSASWWQLRRSVGRRLASVLISSRDLMQGALREEVEQGPVIASRKEVIHFLKLHLGSLNRERLVALYVDSKLRLLKIERIADGSLTECPIHMTRIVHSGLDVGASGVLLVHNHPSGDATPSQADIRETARFERIAADLDLILVDHLIVTRGEVRSIKQK